MLVSIAILVALGHVCALPAHAEAHHDPVTADTTPAGESGGDDASCEATPAPSPHAAPAPAGPTALVAARLPQVPPSVGVPAAPPRASRSSPLFIVHLALLI